MARTLVDLAPGDESVVTRIDGSGAIRQRLLDMGITRGACVRCYRLAPLGDPIEISVKGSLLAIRKSVAKFVQIES
jgi:ferrous iron transport protein A